MKFWLMIHLTILFILFLTCSSMAMAKLKVDACEEKPSELPIKQENAHWSNERLDGRIEYFIQDREIYKCHTKSYNNRIVSKKEWENSLPIFGKIISDGNGVFHTESDEGTIKGE